MLLKKKKAEDEEVWQEREIFDQFLLTHSTEAGTTMNSKYHRLEGNARDDEARQAEIPGMGQLDADRINGNKLILA